MLDIPAAYLAARRSGAAFFPYFFDDWSQQAVFAPRRRRVAELIERRILRGATAVLVPNEFLEQDVRRRSRVRTVIVRNGCDVEPLRPMPTAASAEGSIVYTGAVYEANYDAFRNLLRALDTGVPASLHIYTAQGSDHLAAAGVQGRVTVHAHRPLAEIPLVHARADILFLPLGFDTPYPDLIRSSSPAKMGEYLAAGRPILVHAPPNAFVSSYFSKHGCGVVVDELDPERLASTIRRLLDDDELRNRVSSAARACAIADFDINAARSSFAAAVGIPSSKLCSAATA
jgi:glycosyltransferase involved in cell wall biosynthesis